MNNKIKCNNEELIEMKLIASIKKSFYMKEMKNFKQAIVPKVYPKVGVPSRKILRSLPKPRPGINIILLSKADFRNFVLNIPKIHSKEKPIYKPIIALKKLFSSTVFSEISN